MQKDAIAAMGEKIEMRRLSDGAIYTFVRAADENGMRRYRRADKNIWMLRHPDFGWVVWDADADCLMGRPWTVALSQQGDCPPEGDWVSRKDANSFVYRLVFVA
jgi:hypothetical protein